MRQDILRYPLSLICAAALVAGSAETAGAQATDQAPTPVTSQMSGRSLSLTPFFALGDDLAPGAGAAFTYQWTPNASIEAEASLGMDAARSSVSLLYSLPQLGRFIPYVAAGIGVQRDEFEMVTDVGFFTRKKTEAAANIGAGVTVPVNARWSYRADFRWYNPDNEWPESWRAYSGIVFGIRR